MQAALYTQRNPRRGRSRSSTGRTSAFTLVEVVIVLAVVGVMIAAAVGGLDHWLRSGRARDMARQMADILLVTREAAIRSGEVHVVFFEKDKAGLALDDGTGRTVAALAIRDADGDGAIDSGEELFHVDYPSSSVSWGHARATDRAFGDPGGTAGSPPAAALTFEKPDGSAATWIAFLPDGTPRAYLTNTVAGVGAVGTGGGAIYLSNEERDYAVVLSTLGGVQVQTFDPVQNAWRR